MRQCNLPGRSRSIASGPFMAGQCTQCIFFNQSADDRGARHGRLQAFFRPTLMFEDLDDAVFFMLISQNSGLLPLLDSCSLGRRTVIEVSNRTWADQKKERDLLESRVQEGTHTQEDFETEFPLNS